MTRRSPPRGDGILRPTKAALRDLSTSMAQMLRAGMGVVELLRTLASNAPRSLRLPLEGMAEAVHGGATLSAAMERYPAVFSMSDVQVIRGSERIGEVARGFDTIAEGIEERLALRRRLVRSAVYPMIVVLVHVFLSPVTRLVLESPQAYLAVVARNLGILAALAIFVLWGIPAIVRATPVGTALERAAWRLPWPGTIYVAHVRAMFARALSGCLSAGVTLHESLRGSAALTSDPSVIERAEEVSELVASGSELAPELVRSRLVDPADAMVLLAGERAGSMAGALDTVSARYSERRTRGLDGLMKAAGALLTVAVFVLVALSVVETYRGITRGADDIMREIEKSTPILQMKDGKGGLPSIEDLRSGKGVQSLEGLDDFDSLGKDSPFRGSRPEAP